MSRFTNHAGGQGRIPKERSHATQKKFVPRRSANGSIDWNKWILPAIGAVVLIIVFHSLTT